jgi:dTDP-4-dehydrorhamnose reductase
MKNPETLTLALVGANGMLAKMIRETAPEESRVAPFDLPDFDITNRGQVLEALAEARPDVIVNCAAFTDVDGCESREELALRVNGEGPGNLARAARKLGSVLVHVSTDYVFDGLGHCPYTEEDPVGPQSAYGRSKLRGERAILESGLGKYLIVRTSWLYGPGGKNFVDTIARLAAEREELRIVADQVGSPTYTQDLARALFNLIDAETGQKSASGPGPYGLYHFSNEGTCTWYEFAREIIAGLREGSQPVNVRRILPISTEEYPLPARRPAYSVLSKEKYRRVTGKDVPDWRDGLARYLMRRGVVNRGDEKKGQACKS